MTPGRVDFVNILKRPICQFMFRMRGKQARFFHDLAAGGLMPSLFFKILAARDGLPSARIGSANEQNLGFDCVNHNQNRFWNFVSRTVHCLFILHELCLSLGIVRQLSQKHL